MIKRAPLARTHRVDIAAASAGLTVGRHLGTALPEVESQLLMPCKIGPMPCTASLKAVCAQDNMRCPVDWQDGFGMTDADSEAWHGSHLKPVRAHRKNTSSRHTPVYTTAQARRVADVQQSAGGQRTRSGLTAGQFRARFPGRNRSIGKPRMQSQQVLSAPGVKRGVVNSKERRT